jgi:hypothetical protein
MGAFEQISALEVAVMADRYAPGVDSAPWCRGMPEPPASTVAFRRTLNHDLHLHTKIPPATPMAANPCPRNSGDLRAFAHRLMMGCRLHEEAIGIKQNTEAALLTVLDAEAAAQLQAGKTLANRGAADRALEVADDAGRVKLLHCRMRLASKISRRWSAAWAPTGFPDRSTAVPRTQDLRYILLSSLGHYFNARPDHESAEMGATAADCEAAWTALHEARLAANEAEFAVTQTIRARRAAVKALRKRCRGLVRELQFLLERDDPRWKSFGLKVPASELAKSAAKEQSGEERDERSAGDARIIPMPRLNSTDHERSQSSAAR